MNAPRFLLLLLLAALALVLTWTVAGDRDGTDGVAREPDPPPAAGGPSTAADVGPLASGQRAENRVPQTGASAAATRGSRTLLDLRFVSALDRSSLADVRYEIGLEGPRARAAAEGEWRHRGQGDGLGQAQAEVPADTALWVRVWASEHHGFAFVQVQPLTAGTQVQREVVVPAGRDLAWYGRAVFDGAPVPGARVRVYGQRDNQPWLVEELETDATGLVQLRGWSWKAMDVRVDAPGVGIAVAPVEPGHVSPAQAQVLPLWPVGTLHAWVEDADEQPREGVLVELEANTYSLRPPDATSSELGRLAWEAETDAAGLARIEDVAAEILLDVSLWADDLQVYRQEGSLTLPAGRVHEAWFTLDATAAIPVRVIDAEDRPLEGAEVWLVRNTYAESNPRILNTAHGRQAEARSGADGRLRFDEVPLGAWYVGVVNPDPGTVSLAQPLHLSAGSRPPEVVLRVGRGLAIGGRLVDEAGAGIEGLTVTVFGRDFGGSRSQRSAADGAFRLEPLAPGTYWMSLGAERRDLVLPLPFEVEAGAEDLELVLHRGGRIRGIALEAASGRPLGDVQVRAFAYRTDRPNYALGNRFSAEPEFEITGLDSGVYALLVTTDEGRIGVVNGVDVRRPEATEGVEVALEPGVSVRVRYEGPAEHCTVLVTQRDATLSYVRQRPGVTEAFVAPPGYLSIHLDPEGGEPLTLERYVEGDEVELVVP